MCWWSALMSMVMWARWYLSSCAVNWFEIRIPAIWFEKMWAWNFDSLWCTHGKINSALLLCFLLGRFCLVLSHLSDICFCSNMPAEKLSNFKFCSRSIIIKFDSDSIFYCITSCVEEYSLWKFIRSPTCCYLENVCLLSQCTWQNSDVSAAYKWQVHARIANKRTRFLTSAGFAPKI